MTSSRNDGSEARRRDDLARIRGFGSRAEQRRHQRLARNRADVASMPPRAQRERQAALRTVSLMREDHRLSLQDAAFRAATSPEAVLWYARPALERRGGRWVVTDADRLYRAMYVNSGGAQVHVDVRGSRKASELSAYHRAVSHYLDTGDNEALRHFVGKSVGGYEYDTDLDVLDEMARRGQLDIESIYQLVA